MVVLNEFPNTSVEPFIQKSHVDVNYNCIAWAAEDNERWWWPDSQNIDYWPAGVPREVTINAFIQAYQTIGYEVCDRHNLEPGFQKIAIYADSAGKPTHAARQLPDGKWTSKLGQDEDIQHQTLEGLVGEIYGNVACIMKKAL